MSGKLQKGVIVVSILVIALIAAGAGPLGDRGGLLNRNCQLQSRLVQAEMTIAALNQRLAKMEASNVFELDQYVIVEEKNVARMNGPHIIFRGANVHIQNGSGITYEDNEDQKGVGNLVIGYNEDYPEPSGGDRKGWHNVIIGPGHRFPNSGGLVAGAYNLVDGTSATVSGGAVNRASGYAASVSGGILSAAGGDQSSISGGFFNLASGPHSSVTGGAGNEAGGDYASVTGGEGNEAIEDYSSVSGGRINDAIGAWSSVSGGASNKAIGIQSSVSGGEANEARNFDTSISGGVGRSVDRTYNWRAGRYFSEM